MTPTPSSNSDDSKNPPPPCKFTLEGLHVPGELVRVYDGDTFTLVLPVCCQRYSFSCRLLDLDTPELRSRNPHEKTIAYQIRDWVRETLSTTPFQVHCHGFDKYGRVLCDIELQDERGDLADWLVTHGCAYRYHGKTKQSFDTWFDETKYTLHCTSTHIDS
jgi:endonuclease YncB( thermonuclease family)